MVSLSLERWRIVSKTIGPQVNVAKIGPIGEPKKWLTLRNTLRLPEEISVDTCLDFIKLVWACAKARNVFK